jgi:hypothetical protein
MPNAPMTELRPATARWLLLWSDVFRLDSFALAALARRSAPNPFSECAGSEQRGTLAYQTRRLDLNETRVLTSVANYLLIP